MPLALSGWRVRCARSPLWMGVYAITCPCKGPQVAKRLTSSSRHGSASHADQPMPPGTTSGLRGTERRRGRRGRRRCRSATRHVHAHARTYAHVRTAARQRVHARVHRCRCGRGVVSWQELAVSPLGYHIVPPTCRARPPLPGSSHAQPSALGSSHRAPAVASGRPRRGRPAASAAPSRRLPRRSQAWCRG
jgi:hypothetical protein